MMDDLFAKAPIPKAYFQLALPVVLGMVASMIYNLADTFFVAQTQNANLLAGVALCTPLFSLMLAFGDILGLGGSALISRLLGAKNAARAKQASAVCFYGAIVLSVVVSATLLIFERPILSLLGATASTYQYAASFYRVFAIGGGAIIVSLIPGNLLRTEGLATQSMIGTLVGTAVTIALDPVMIFSLHLGAAGAALANVIGYLISDAVLVSYVVKQAKVLTVDIRQVKFNRVDFKQIVLIGVPASITNLMQSFGTALLNNYLAGYGATGVAALGIALKIYLVVMLVMVGFAFGAQPLIGFNYGAKNHQRLRKIIHFDFGVEVVAALVLAGILMIFAPQLAGLFMNDVAVVRAAALMLRALLCTTPLIGAILVFTTMFQSMNQAGSAFWMSITRQGLFLWAVISVMAAVWQYSGVIWAQPVADVLTFVLGVVLYRQLRF